MVDTLNSSIGSRTRTVWSDAPAPDGRVEAAAVDTARTVDPQELADAQARVLNLEAALLSSRTIGMAMGIIMARHGLTVDAAFDQLRQASQNAKTKLHIVAEQVVLTGALPTE